jgi:hypothetical protein
MPETTGNNAPNPEAAAARAADAAIAKAAGNAVKALRRSQQEIHELQRINERLEQQLTDAKAKVPGDGAVVLTKDEAKLWEGFKALECEPKDVEELIDSYEALLASEEKRELSTVIAKAADDIGWNRHALPVILRDRGLAAEMREVVIQDDEGQRTKANLLHVRPANKENAPWELVDQYIQRELPEYLPMLESIPAEGEEAEGEETEGAEEQQQPLGTTALDNGRGTRKSAYGAVSKSAPKGVQYPKQRAPQSRATPTRADFERAKAAKAATGEYNGF